MPETDVSIPNLTEDDFPALYLAADRTSRMAQKRHLWFTGTILGALVACATLGTLSAAFPRESKVLALFSTAWAAVSFMLTSMRKALKPEKALVWGARGGGGRQKHGLALHHGLRPVPGHNACDRRPTPSSSPI